MSCYGKYPIDRIPQYCADEERCVMGCSPTLIEFGKAFGSDAIHPWLCTLINYITDATATSRAGSTQMGMIIALLKGRYGTLKLSELMLFAYKFLAGDYEKMFRNLDIQAITRSLNKFLEYKANIIDRVTRRLEVGKKTEALKVDGGVNFSVYVQTLVRSLQGDAAAQSCLRISSEEDMIRSACVRVSYGDIDENLLAPYADRYGDLIADTIDKSRMYLGLAR